MLRAIGAICSRHTPAFPAFAQRGLLRGAEATSHIGHQSISGAFMRAGIMLPGLSRLYGESLSYRKFFFMKSIKVKGQMSFRGKRDARGSWKKAIKRNPKMYKLKTCNSMKLRVKIVGPRHDRRFKVLRPGFVHLLRNKTTAQLRRSKRPKYIHKADLYRVKKMLPYWKRQKFKNTV